MHPTYELTLPKGEISNACKHWQYDDNNSDERPNKWPKRAKDRLALSGDEVQEMIHLVPYTLLTVTGPNIGPNLALIPVPAEILTAPSAKFASCIAGILTV